MYTLGIDIGTFESKGVIATHGGKIIAQSSRPHQMIVPHPGWAEHRATEDWWRDCTNITNDLLATSQVNPHDIKAIATSAIGPCMLPLDAAGTPLMNAVLSGVDTPPHAETPLLNPQLPPDTAHHPCALALPPGWPSGPVRACSAS